MSTVSQTPARKPVGFGRRMAIGMAITAAILAIALRGSGPYMARKLAEAQIHGPDLALFAQLSLPIKLHIFGAISALVLGAVLMTVRKGRLFHRVAGWVWVSFAALVAISSVFILQMNHGRFSILHLFTVITAITLPLGVLAAKRHKVIRHRSTMMGLFYGGFAINMLIAFIPGRTMWELFFG